MFLSFSFEPGLIAYVYPLSYNNSAKSEYNRLVHYRTLQMPVLLLNSSFFGFIL
jgi:hypothetical protein